PARRADEHVARRQDGRIRSRGNNRQSRVEYERPVPRSVSHQHAAVGERAKNGERRPDGYGRASLDWTHVTQGVPVLGVKGTRRGEAKERDVAALGHWVS